MKIYLSVLNKQTALIFIYLLTIVPSSSLTAIKSIFFCLLLFIFFLNLFIKKHPIDHREMLLFSGITIFFIFSYFNALIHDNSEYSLRAFCGYYGTITMAMVLFLHIKTNVIKIETILRHFFIAVLIYALLKISVFLLPFILKINMYAYSEVLGLLVPGMCWQLINVGPDSFFLRLTIGNDSLLVIGYLFFLMRNSYKVAVSRLFFWLFNLSIFFDLIMGTTRYFFIEIILGIVCYYFLFNLRYIAKPIIFLLAILCVFILSWNTIPEFQQFYNIRMNDIQSLQIKNQQFTELINEWQDNIIFGKGVGSYIQNYIRSFYQPYQYEVQWASFLLQFGIIGIFLFFFFFFFLTIKKLFVHCLSISKTNLYLLFILALFLASGFTNPYLLIMNSCIVYALIFGMLINISQYAGYKVISRY